MKKNIIVIIAIAGPYLKKQLPVLRRRLAARRERGTESDA